MNIQMVIVLCILAFMVIMLLTHKIPYGVTGMICCTLFVLTGVADLKTSFSGLSSSTTILVAPMIVVASALGKTSIIHRLRIVMDRIQKRNGFFLVIVMSLVTIVLAQLMGQIACISVMLMLIQTLDDDSDLSPARMLFLVATVNCIATSKIPVGMGATMPGILNSYYEGLVGPGDLLEITDYFKAAILPLTVGTIYCIFAYKLIPNGGIDKSQVKDVKEQEAIPRRNEMIIFGVFAVVMAGFMFTNRLGSDITNVLPAAGVLILILFNVMPLKEVLTILTGDMVWMIASMSVMSTVLGNTGVGDLIGQTVLSILGGNPSGLFVTIVFCITCTVMTNFMSNVGTMALMCPIAAATAMAGGMNVKAAVLTCGVSAWFAVVMPTGCAGSMMAFGIGNHNAFKLMRFTMPLVLLLMISLVIGVNLFFPVYG